MEPSVFEAHLQVLADAGAVMLTVSELVRRLRGGSLPEHVVALTFDDAFASVVSEASPRLQRRGWPATVYCVAGHLGGMNDWPTQPAAVPRRRLASAQEIADLAATGFEIGGHTVSHAPLSGLAGTALHDEVVGCRDQLEALVGGPVRTFACPYGDPPGGEARELLRRTYAAVCGTSLDTVGPAADPYALRRVDAHYVRSPRLLEHVVHRGGRGYLALRRTGARARRFVVPTWADAGS